MASDSSQTRFGPEDYAILGTTLLVSAGCSLYVSTVKNKQSSLVEYFIAGRNVPFTLVVLSYFSSVAAGGMTGLAIETYSFGAQVTISVFILIPLSCCFLHYLVVPVFYRLQDISMLKYFEIRFGRVVCLMAMIASIFQMVSVGTINLYVAATAIHQVSALSFWVSVSILAFVCIAYSTLGGMRGIVIADAIQAVVMIVGVIFILIMGIIKSGSVNNIWDINSRHGRLQFFNMSLDPTVRFTFLSTIFGHNFMIFSHLVVNQTLLQRCQMAPNLNSAQKMANIGSTMTFIYVFIFQVLGLVIFAYYGGCNIVQTGSIIKMNQLVSYFAMDVLHQYPTLPGIFFSGLLCATLSTASSILNSISALIMAYYVQNHPMHSNEKSMLLCKSIVVAFGGIMVLSIALIDNFHNFYQAASTLVSIATGPTLAVYLLGILCPRANHKCVAISSVIAMMFGLWITVGSIVAPTIDPLAPFANCSSHFISNNVTVSLLASNATKILSTRNSEAYFPLAKLSYAYVGLEVFVATVVSFILLTIVFGPQPCTNEQRVSQLTIELIPRCVQSVQLKLSRRMRRRLLCDVYPDVYDDVTQVQRLMEK